MDSTKVQYESQSNKDNESDVKPTSELLIGQKVKSKPETDSKLTKKVSRKSKTSKKSLEKDLKPKLYLEPNVLRLV